MKGSEVYFLGAGQTDIDDIRSGIHQPFGHSLFQRRATQANVSAYHYPARLKVFTKGPANTAGNVLVQFNAELAPDVIGLETTQFHAHRP